MRIKIIILGLLLAQVVAGQVINMGAGVSDVRNTYVYPDTINFDSIRIGNATDYTVIDDKGIRMYGGATQWDDLTISALSLAGGVQAPSLRAIIGGIASQAFNFQTANDIVYGVAQLSHSWVYADSIEVHFHCMIEASPSAGDTVVVDFEYTWADINETVTGSDTIQVKIPVAGWTAKQHKLVEVGWLNGADKTLSSNIAFRIERRRDLASDTYDSANNWWHLWDIDFHYKKNKLGSNDEASDP